MSDVLALMSDDVVVNGIDDCSGAPCIGHEGARTGYLERAMKSVRRRNESWSVEGDQITAHYCARPLHWPPAAAQACAFMTFTVRNGLITRVDNVFELDDPETVVLRVVAQGNVVIALRDPKTEVIFARVLLQSRGSGTSLMTTLTDRRGSRNLTGTLRRGTCKTRDATSSELHFAPGTLDTRLELTIAQLQTTVFSIELQRAGIPVACGDLPLSEE
jgi:hypothetical protein